MAEVTFNWKKLIWTPELLPKLKFFLWKAENNALPIGANLQKRGLLANTNCSRCGEIETIDHILIHCTYAKKVWTLGPWKDTVNPTDESTFRSMLQAAVNWNNYHPGELLAMPLRGLSG